MEDHNSPEAVAKRASQEDPIVMYLIVRESLGMSIGKACAQCAHASQMLLLKYIEMKREALFQYKIIHSDITYACPDGVHPDLDLEKFNWQILADKTSLFQEWLDTSFRKIVLRADDKEWTKLKELPDHVLVVDAGLTQIPAQSETVIGFYPIHKSQAPKIIKKLQLL